MRLCVGPPPSAAVESFHAADLCPHLHEARVARLGSTSDELASACDGLAQRAQHFRSARGIQPVRVADNSQPPRTVGRPPSQLRRVDAVVDRDTHPRECTSVGLEPRSRNLPVRDCSYDAVVDFGALHLADAWQRQIREIARVLRPGGRFFFEQPINPGHRWAIDRPGGGRLPGGFGQEELVDEIHSAGLSTIGLSRVGLGRLDLIGVARKEVK